jgi:hypothetical protein
MYSYPIAIIAIRRNAMMYVHILDFSFSVPSSPTSSTFVLVVLLSISLFTAARAFTAVIANGENPGV